MKPGANKTEQHDMFVLWTQGHTVEDVARHMGIYPVTVKKFFDHFAKGGHAPPPTSAAMRPKPGMPRHPGQANEMLSAELAIRDHTIGELTARLAKLEATQSAGPAVPPEAPKTTTVQVPGTTKK